MTGAVAEPVTTETEVTEAGSQPVVVQEDSAGDSDDEEELKSIHHQFGNQGWSKVTHRTHALFASDPGIYTFGTKCRILFELCL